MPMKVSPALVRKLGAQISPAIQAGSVGIAAAIQNELAVYPTPSRKPQFPRGPNGKAQFASDRQRRYVMALVRAGKIPYVRRSGGGGLGSRWNIAPLKLGARLENRAAHAALVMGRYRKPQDQARYHRGTWTNVDTAVARARSQFNPIMQDAIRRALNGR